MVCNRWQHHDTVQVLVPTWSDKRNRRLAFGSFKKMDMCKSWHASFHEALADQLCVFANRQRSSKKRTNTSKYSLSITQSPPKKNIVKALHESLSPPFKAAKGLLDFPLLPRESPHRDSHSLLWRVAVLHCPWWIGEEDDITYKSGEFAKFLQCAMVIFRGRQGIPKFHDIWYGEKKTELHQDVDMFQKNSLKKTTLQRSKHLSPTHFYIYIYIHHFSTPFRSHWIMVGSYPDPQVVVSPQKATFEAIPFAPHRHQSTSDAAGVAQDTTARGASAERVFWWLKNHTKWQLDIKIHPKNWRTQQDFDL